MGDPYDWAAQAFRDDIKKLIERDTQKMADDPMLQWFNSDHLKPSLQAVSKPFGDLARKIVDEVPRNPERTVALRKLLEAKDCAVRAFLYVGAL